MKYAIHMKLSGWIGYDWIIEAESPDAIYDKIYEIQDLNCLYSMGSCRETGKNAKEGLARLGQFLEKMYSGDLKIEDYKLIDLDLSIGSFHVLDVAKGKQAIDALKAAHPECEIK